METSYPRLNKEKALLVSPAVDDRYNCLGFYYHMYGDHINTLNVYLRTNSGDALVWSLSQNQGDVWNKAQVPFVTSNRKFQVSFLIFIGFYILFPAENFKKIYKEATLQFKCILPTQEYMSY